MSKKELAAMDKRRAEAELREPDPYEESCDELAEIGNDDEKTAKV